MAFSCANEHGNLLSRGAVEGRRGEKFEGGRKTKKTEEKEVSDREGRSDREGEVSDSAEFEGGSKRQGRRREMSEERSNRRKQGEGGRKTREDRRR